MPGGMMMYPGGSSTFKEGPYSFNPTMSSGGAMTQPMATSAQPTPMPMMDNVGAGSQQAAQPAFGGGGMPPGLMQMFQQMMMQRQGGQQGYPGMGMGPMQGGGQQGSGMSPQLQQMFMARQQAMQGRGGMAPKMPMQGGGYSGPGAGMRQGGGWMNSLFPGGGPGMRPGAGQQPQQGMLGGMQGGGNPSGNWGAPPQMGLGQAQMAMRANPWEQGQLLNSFGGNESALHQANNAYQASGSNYRPWLQALASQGRNTPMAGYQAQQYQNEGYGTMGPGDQWQWAPGRGWDSATTSAY